MLTTLAALAVLTVVDATPAQALRCGTRLVHEGDTPSQVRNLCGEPSDVVTTTETRTRTVHRRVAGVVVSDTVSVEVRVVRWVYNFGPQRFMRRLVFEDGQLVDIEELGRGN
jgi:hypothetical protein